MINFTRHIWGFLLISVESHFYGISIGNKFCLPTNFGCFLKNSIKEITFFCFFGTGIVGLLCIPPAILVTVLFPKMFGEHFGWLTHHAKFCSTHITNVCLVKTRIFRRQKPFVSWRNLSGLVLSSKKFAGQTTNRLFSLVLQSCSIPTMSNF